MRSSRGKRHCASPRAPLCAGSIPQSHGPGWSLDRGLYEKHARFLTACFSIYTLPQLTALGLAILPQVPQISSILEDSTIYFEKGWFSFKQSLSVKNIMNLEVGRVAPVVTFRVFGTYEQRILLPSRRRFKRRDPVCVTFERWLNIDSYPSSNWELTVSSDDSAGARSRAPPGSSCARVLGTAVPSFRLLAVLP